MTDAELMAAIREKYGSLITDSTAAPAAFPISAAFVAALVANESGLNEQASRFEQNVLAQLSLVVIGRKDAFGSITIDDLDKYIPASFSFAHAMLAMVNLSSSWGPTQIMGYQALAGGYSIAELTDITKHFSRAVQIIEDFVARFHLAIAGGPVNYPGLFRCWNTGNPNGATFDPHYVQNGVMRMSLYESEDHDG